MQASVAVRNAELAAIAATVGPAGVLVYYTGAAPANAAAARTGSILATLNLPTTPFAPPSGGVMGKNGTWEQPLATGAGAAGYYTIFASDGVTVCLQGPCGVTGGAAEMQLDNINIAVGTDVLVTAFALTAGNA